MDVPIKVIIGLEIAFFAGCGILLVYLIFKRIQDKKEETFEKRDN